MKKIKLESYNERSMESGPTGWDGIIREEPQRVMKDEDDFDELRDPLEGVPEDPDDDIIALKEKQENYFHSMSMSEMARDITRDVDVPTDRDVKKATEVVIDEIGEDEFDKYMAELEER